MKKASNVSKETEEIRVFLVEHPLISINGLEIITGVPRTSLSRVVSGNRMRIPEHNIGPIVEELKKYGFKPTEQ